MGGNPEGVVSLSPGLLYSATLGMELGAVLALMATLKGLRPALAVTLPRHVPSRIATAATPLGLV